jgi:hypothetical protein
MESGGRGVGGYIPNTPNVSLYEGVENKRPEIHVETDLRTARSCSIFYGLHPNTRK